MEDSMADDDSRGSARNQPQQETSKGFRMIFIALIALLAVAILLLATGLVKMTPLG